MKITILMPVFNEEQNIAEAIESVLFQTVSDWELLIINDGSTDNTIDIIKGYKDQRITLLDKSNSDQLDSIKFALPKVSGELIYLLHGDDRIHSLDVFEKTLKVFLNKPINYISYPYCKMRSSGEIFSVVKPKNVYLTRFLKANLLLNFGRNLKSDPFFCRKKYFTETVLKNYINRNKPFWMDLEDDFSAQSISVDYPVFDYRCHEGNYLNSKIGLYNVINGNIRSTLDLLAVVSVPYFSLQRILFKIYNKLGLIGMPVIYRNKVSTSVQSLEVLNQLLDMYNVNFNDYRLLKLVKKYQENVFLEVLDLSNLELVENDRMAPPQVRLLNKAIIEGDVEHLPQTFYSFLISLEKGVGEIVCSKDNIAYVKEYLDLLNVRLKVSHV